MSVISCHFHFIFFCQCYSCTSIKSWNDHIFVLVIVQGFCCPLQQRPSSGRYLHRVTPESRSGGSGSMFMLSDLKGGLQSREMLHSRAETRPDGEAPALNNQTGPVAKATGEWFTSAPDHLYPSLMLTEESLSRYSVDISFCEIWHIVLDVKSVVIKLFQ